MARLTTTRAPGAERNSDHIASLAKGLQILRCFQPGDDVLGNKDLAQRTGLPRPTVARFTGTLVELGYLSTNPDRRYRLTSAVLDLGFAFLSNFDIRPLVRPFLQEVADFAMTGCSIGTIDGQNMLYLEQCRSRIFSMHLQTTVGSRVPIATTGMGRAYLAGLPRDQLRNVMTLLKASHGSEWNRLRRAVESSIEEVHQRGFCTAIGTWRAGVNSVGVPLITREGARIYGVTCAGPSDVLSEEKLVTVVGPKLLEVVRSASTLIL